MSEHGLWNYRWVIVMIGGIVITFTAMVVIIVTLMSYKRSGRIYDNAVSRYVTVSGSDDMTADGAGGSESGYTEVSYGSVDMDPKGQSMTVNVDMDAITAAYPDVIGWIIFENEDISYPVLYSGDNEKYLHTTYTGEDLRAGSIFMAGESAPDFSDPHTIIYGHNMRNGSMFGKLKNYLNEGYYEDHQYFRIYTQDTIRRYRILDYQVVATDYYIYGVTGRSPDALHFLIDDINAAGKAGKEAVSETDHFVTLSTCANDGKDRMIVNAVLCDMRNR